MRARSAPAAGRVAFDGAAREAIVRYRRALAESDPAERGAGLREWGTGEATIAAARLLGRDGVERGQFLAGEPLALEVAVDVHQLAAPPLLQLELRDEAGLLVAADSVDTQPLGWDGPGRFRARLDVPSLPLADGRFHLRLGLAAADGEPSCTGWTMRLTFLVYPDGEGRGLVRLEGTWTADAND